MFIYVPTFSRTLLPVTHKAFSERCWRTFRERTS